MATLAGEPLALDNGQHILIGAYSETLRLMQDVGVNVEAAFLRLPLTMQFPDGSGLKLPHWPARASGTPYDHDEWSRSAQYSRRRLRSVNNGSLFYITDRRRHEITPQVCYPSTVRCAKHNLPV